MNEDDSIKMADLFVRCAIAEGEVAVGLDDLFVITDDVARRTWQRHHLVELIEEGAIAVLTTEVMEEE